MLSPFLDRINPLASSGSWLTKILLGLLLVLSAAFPAFAGFPPTTTKASGDSSQITTFNFDFPYMSVTRSGITTTFNLLSVAGGGTGESSQATNGITYYNGSGITSSSTFVYNGALGIGTTTPNAPISIGASSGDKIYVYDGGVGSSYGFGYQSGILQIFSAASGDSVQIGTGGSSTGFTPLMTVLGSGNVGIGTTNPGTLLTVAGAGAFGGQIHTVTDPTSAQDAATKNYVDTQLAQLNPLAAVYAASTTNIPGTYTNAVSGVCIGDTFQTTSTTQPFVVDGATPSVGGRILLKNQTSSFQDGVWNLTTQAVSGVSGAIFTRASDFDTSADINSGAIIPVVNGTVNAGSSWYQTAVNTTCSSSSQTWTMFQQPSSAYLLAANNLSDVATKATAFNNISPMTTGGDLIYGGASGAGTRLANGSANQVLTSAGSTSAPSWSLVANASLANMSTLTVKSNITGGSTSPADNTLTAIIDAAIGSTQGDILYRSSSVWSVLAPGTSGYALTTGGSAANPSWTSVLTNPMTTAGDMIYGGSSGTPTRLSAGSSGQVPISAGSSVSFASLQGNATALKAPTYQIFTSTGTQTGWLFTVTGWTGTIVAGDTYTNNGNTYTAQMPSQTNGGSGATLFMSGTGTTSGTTLTKATSASGPATITFSATAVTASYTVPSSPTPLYIEVEVQGSGGGGGGSGSSAVSGSAGNQTYFGANITSVGGGGAADGGSSADPGSAGGGGGVATTTTNTATTGVTFILSLVGNSGSMATTFGGSGNSGAGGGLGGASIFGGVGTPTFQSAPNATTANSGSGGSGAAASDYPGGGGGSGAYVKLQMNTAAYSGGSTFPYIVGTGGSGGVGSAHTGGAGAAGIIIVKEHYQ